jgi:cytochrome c oxidase subunit I+III
MNGARVLDVSHLPPGAFGYRSLMWWATTGLMLIEGTVFALAIGAYLYLWSRAPAWPPGAIRPPDLLWSTINTLVLLASAVPNHFTARAAEKVDLRRTRRWLVISLLFAFAFAAIRILEFQYLNVAWDHDAYGSLTWLLLGLHTVHIGTDALDSSVLALLLYMGPIEEMRFVDVAENSLYWYFVVLTWLPIYGVIYWVPRL